MNKKPSDKFFDKLRPSKRRLDRELGAPAVRMAQNEQRFSGDVRSDDDRTARREAQASRRLRVQAGLAIFVVAAGMFGAAHGGLRGTLRDARAKVEHMLDSGAGVPQAEADLDYAHKNITPGVKDQLADDHIGLTGGPLPPQPDRYIDDQADGE